MNFWKRIKLLFVRVGAVLKNVLSVVFATVGKKLVEELLAFAIEVCSGLEASDLASGEKRKAAFKEIKASAEERGHALKDSTINWLIESAVIYLKGFAE